MKYELYRAAYAGEMANEHIASLTDVDLVEPKQVTLRPGVGTTELGSLTFKTDDAIDGRISAHYAYFIVDENGKRSDFQVSQIGQPIKEIDGYFVIKFR